MTEIMNGPAGRVARVRTLMEERGYDAVIIRDEANLRWLTGAEGVFDFTGELPHCAFISCSSAYLHTDSRYFNSFEEHMPEGHEWKLDMDGFDMMVSTSPNGLPTTRALSAAASLRSRTPWSLPSITDLRARSRTRLFAAVLL